MLSAAARVGMIAAVCSTDAVEPMPGFIGTTGHCFGLLAVAVGVVPTACE